MLARRAGTSPVRCARPARPAYSELQFLIGSAMVGNMFVHCGGVMIDSASLALRKVANGGRETRIDDVVHGMGERRNETSRHLVLSLRSRLEALQPVFNAVLDPLVVAGLEVQAVKIAACSPISAEQGVLSHEENGHRDRL